MPPEAFSGNVLDFFRDNGNIRVTAAVQGDARTVPDSMYFLQRTPLQNLTGGELRGRWRGTAVIADHITYDAASHVYKMLEVKTFESEIPKIKFGTYLGESEIMRILEIGGPTFAATGQVPDFIRRILATLTQQLVTGRRWRLEVMMVGALLDGYHYDRLNVKIDGTWGKSADMKVTIAVPWTEVETATPIDDIVGQIDYARINRGVILNRLIMSTAAFDAAVATDQFAAKRQLFYNPITVDESNLPVLDREGQRALLQRMTRVQEIVLYDSYYRWEDETRTRHLHRILPINAVILDNTANDNNPAVRFMGNGPVLEEAMIGRVGAQSFGEGGPAEVNNAPGGPFYYTSVDEHLDPPVINLRVAQSAWPQMLEPDSNAVLWVAPEGGITESVAVSDTW